MTVPAVPDCVRHVMVVLLTTVVSRHSLVPTKMLNEPDAAKKFPPTHVGSVNRHRHRGQQRAYR
jgi:hypothetical protein